MKRSPLKRKTPLRRQKPMRRPAPKHIQKTWSFMVERHRMAVGFYCIPRKTKLQPASKEKRRWNARYHRALAAAKAEQVSTTGSTFCVHCGKIGPVEGHHPKGRTGARIMEFILLARDCHRWVHEHAREARKEGWLA